MTVPNWFLSAPIVGQTASAPGTGAFTLSAATAPMRSAVSQVGSGNYFRYSALSYGDGTTTGGLQWEVGYGVVTAGSGTDTLTRVQVLDGSNGLGNLVNFTYSVNVFSAPPAIQTPVENGVLNVTASTALTPISARTVVVNMSAGSQVLTLPSEAMIPSGTEITIINTGSNAFAVNDSAAGTVIASVVSGKCCKVLSKSNATAAGNWIQTASYP